MATIRKRAVRPAFVSLLLTEALLSSTFVAALADTISPAITGAGMVYSKEAPNSSFYGTGVAGRMNEASALRFEGEQDTAAQNYDLAIKKLSKAIQLDPSDPTGHVLYARALSAKIDRANGEVPLSLVNQALYEWRLIWHHDADLLEQVEGHKQARHLQKIAKALIKRGASQEGEQLAAAPDRKKKRVRHEKDFDGDSDFQ